MFVKPKKGRSVRTLPAATYCLWPGEMLNLARTGIAVWPLVTLK